MQPIDSDRRVVGACRAALGVYLLWFFLRLIPLRDEFLSQRSAIAASLAGLGAARLSILHYWNGSGFVLVLLCACAAAAGALAAGYRRRLSALACYAGLVTIFLRDPLLVELHFHYLGWLLLVFAILPDGPPPAPLMAAAWILFGVSYTVSGLGKLRYPPWRAGVVTATLLPTLAPVSYFVDHVVMLAELCCAAMIFRRASRRAIWLALTAMQLGIAAATPLTELSLGVLVFHLFLVEPAWLAADPGKLLHHDI